MQHASRLAMIAVLGTAPLAVAAQDDAVKPIEGEATAEAPQTDEAMETEETMEAEGEVETEAETDTADAEADAEVETDTADAEANAEVETDTADAEADAEVETDTAEVPETDDATDSAEAPATDAPASGDAIDTAETPMTDDPAAADAVAEAPAEEPAKPVEGQITMQSENTILADDLIGSNVYSDAGEKIGDVDDLIVNLDGSVEGVVIGVGGFLGLGEKWVAVKMDSLSTMTDESGTLRLVSSATKADLEAAEAFKTAQDVKAEQQALENAAPQDPNAVQTTEPAPTN